MTGTACPVMQGVEWVWRSFSDLGTEALYEILALRQLVFVVEQACPYLDADGRDRHAYHLLGRAGDGRLVAYLRLVEPGRRFREPSIGRVVTHPDVRGRGLGKQLMREGLVKAARRYPGSAVRISAQQYLQGFYEELGFVRVAEGDPYDEDGIPHIEMLWGQGREGA